MVDSSYKFKHSLLLLILPCHTNSHSSQYLHRRQTQLESAENLSKQLTVQGSAVDKLFSSMTLLEQKISEAKRQKEVNIIILIMNTKSSVMSTIYII